MSLSSEKRISPNHDARAPGKQIDMLLLHYTGMAEAEAALARLTDPAAKVSAHWFVHEDGRLVQMVEEDRRAWHAGVSCWAGETDLNSRSIGIEIHNPGHERGYRDFAEAQVEAVIALCRDILERHPITPERVLAHSDVAPARKLDPGEKFPWDVLHMAGIGWWTEPSPFYEGIVLKPGDSGAEVRDLQGKLAGYGYCIQPTGGYDQATESVVTAFQRHFRPARVDGVADLSTRETLDRLISALA